MEDMIASYSLLVDDLFNIEEQTTLSTITDDEICDDDDSATFEVGDRTPPAEVVAAILFQPSRDEFLSDCNDNFVLKDVDVTNDLELGAVIIKEREEDDLIVFNPRINDVREEIVRSHNENLRFLDSKENVIFDVSKDCHVINAKGQSRETHKSFLMTSLCSPQPSSPSPQEACPAFCLHNQSQASTPPSSSASSPGPPSPMLPPCRVCGEKASGFHYGANTCEACKGFFRRSLQRKQSYRCLGSNNCDILSGKRNVCAACRYQKCLSLGMSKNAIKTGRYTHAKKTKDIQEVKRLQKQQQLVHDTDNNIDSNVTFESGAEAVNEEAAEKLVEKIMKTHRQQTPHTPEFFEKLPHKEHEYMVRRKLKQKVFGPLKPISHDEYSNIYHSTGIDVDGRRAMLEHMLPCIERAVKRFVTFAKAVPGFKELPLEDQIKLIKGSRFEAWLISSYRAFNPDHLLYTHYCGNTVHLEGMARLYDESFLKDIFKMVGMIKKLDLTEEEECVVKAILILFRDRCILQAPELVEIKQMNLIHALDHIHKRRKPKDRIFFGKLLGVLTEMRTLTDLHTSQENKIQTEWSKDICMPPLLYELFYV